MPAMSAVACKPPSMPQWTCLSVLAAVLMQPAYINTGACALMLAIVVHVSKMLQLCP